MSDRQKQNAGWTVESKPVCRSTQGWAPDYFKELWRPAKHDEWALGSYEWKVDISKGWNWHTSTSVAADFKGCKERQERTVKNSCTCKDVGAAQFMLSTFHINIRPVTYAHQLLWIMTWRLHMQPWQLHVKTIDNEAVKSQTLWYFQCVTIQSTQISAVFECK